MESTFSMVRRLLGVESATECKAHVESVIAKLKAEADALAGKEHHKERATKGKLIQQLRTQPRYIDACLVARGLPPLNGHFRSEDTKHAEAAVPLPPEEAARLAAEAEAALKRLEERAKEERAVGGGPSSPAGMPETADEQFLAWRRRAAKLEAKLAEPLEAPPKNTADIDELENLAQEVVNYRLKLKQRHGYRNKDIKAERDLQLLEARLDTLAGAFLPLEDSAEKHGVEVEAEELRQWERRLVAKVAQYNQNTSNLNPAAAKEVEQLLQEIAELKAELSTQGLTEHEQDKDERVLLRLVRLAELRQYDHRDKKQERKERQELGTLRDEVEKLRNKLETHKHRLRDEKKFSQKEVRQDPEVCELEERLATLQRMVGGA